MKPRDEYTYPLVGHALVAVCGTFVGIALFLVVVIVKIAMPH